MNGEDQRVQDERGTDAGGEQPRRPVQRFPVLDRVADVQCEATLQSPLKLL